VQPKLILLIFSKPQLDFFSIAFVIVRHRLQILKGESWIIVEKFGFICALLLISNNRPDGNAGIANSRCTATNSWSFVNGMLKGLDEFQGCCEQVIRQCFNGLEKLFFDGHNRSPKSKEDIMLGLQPTSKHPYTELRQKSN